MSTIAQNLLQVLNASSQEQASPFRLGTIPPGYTAGNPTIIFDGETSASQRTYTKNADLTLNAGDRVLIAMVGHGGVVVCRI